jgi:DNA-binding winged helix-turn-helix (wHTH) protein
MLTIDTASSCSSSLPSRFRLGEWVVDSALCELQRDHERVPLPGLSLSLLLALARRAGELADSGSIMSEVSHHEILNDATLQQCVTLLRRALGDNQGTPRYIATIDGRGYRLLMQPQALPSPALAVPGAPSEAAAPPPTYQVPAEKPAHANGTLSFAQLDSITALPPASKLVLPWATGWKIIAATMLIVLVCVGMAFIY